MISGAKLPGGIDHFLTVWSWMSNLLVSPSVKWVIVTPPPPHPREWDGTWSDMNSAVKSILDDGSTSSHVYSRLFLLPKTFSFALWCAPVYGQIVFIHLQVTKGSEICSKNFWILQNYWSGLLLSLICFSPWYLFSYIGINWKGLDFIWS